MRTTKLTCDICGKEIGEERNDRLPMMSNINLSKVYFSIDDFDKCVGGNFETCYDCTSEIYGMILRYRELKLITNDNPRWNKYSDRVTSINARSIINYTDDLIKKLYDIKEKDGYVYKRVLKNIIAKLVLN